MSSLINCLGSYDSVAAVWSSYPEGGNEGDYVYVSGVLYAWNVYTRTWVLSDADTTAAVSEEPMTADETSTEETTTEQSESTSVTSETEDSTGTSGRLNYLGEYPTLDAVWEAIPEGGYEGDYVTILGEVYDWNIYTFNWGDAGDVEQDPARPNQEFPHDVTIDYNLTVAGPIRAHAIFARLRGTADHSKTSDVAETAKTAEYALRAPVAGVSEEAQHAAEADYAKDSNKWDGHHFSEYLDQKVRTFDEVLFAKVLTKIVQSPDYMEGLLGRGWKIGESGIAEMDALTLRHFLEVPELRYNRVSIEVGNKWNAPGGGIIESVAPDYDEDGNELMTGTICLHLEDGEYGTIAVDDICQGIFHDENNTDSNSIETRDDGIGNFEFAGFFTSYFRITEILDGRNQIFRYQLRGLSERWTFRKHPCEGMHFVGYGNFTRSERQVCRYSTRTYERYLRNVNDWEFTDTMIGAQFGDLSNLKIFGLEMEGYSAYLNNIYMSGTIQQFVNIPIRLEIDTNGDSFLARGETMQVTCRVWKGVYEDVTDQVTSWSIVRDSGDATEDAAWALKEKVKNFAGSIEIAYTDEEDDLGGTAYTVSTLFTIRAEINTDAAEAIITI